MTISKMGMLKGFDKENYATFSLDEGGKGTPPGIDVLNFTNDSTELPTQAPSWTSIMIFPTVSEKNPPPSTIFGSPSIIGDAKTHVIVVSILIGLIVVLTCILAVLAIPLLRDIIRRHMPLDHRRRKRRLVTVDEWLITKTVRAHNKSNRSSIIIAPDDSPESSECMICMEVFEKGSEVSWSSSEDCNHVFHKECIIEWLISHTDCPYCRNCMLPVDSAEVLDSVTIRRMRKLLSKKEKSSYFCLDRGLIINGSDNQLDSCSEIGVTITASKSPETIEINAPSQTEKKGDSEDKNSLMKSIMPVERKVESKIPETDEVDEEGDEVQGSKRNVVDEQRSEFQVENTPSSMNNQIIIEEKNSLMESSTPVERKVWSREEDVEGGNIQIEKTQIATDNLSDIEEKNSLMKLSAPVERKVWSQGSKIDEVDVETGEF